jgi:tRNA G18 (ribose-2'-O)-methylase SpoU
MYDFTVRKFSSLPVARQHKKCAELIRRLYEKALKQEKTEHELALYNQLMQWMQLPSLEKPETQQLSDRYHTHLKQAGLSKKEHHLLPSIRKGDRKEGNPAWPIDIYLDRLRSAHNVGSILRTVEALALGDVYFSADTPFIDHKQVQDTAMGTHEWVQCHRGVELQQLRKPILIMETSPEAVSLYD